MWDDNELGAMHSGTAMRLCEWFELSIIDRKEIVPSVRVHEFYDRI